MARARIFLAKEDDLDTVSSLMLQCERILTSVRESGVIRIDEHS
jgi:hypothetical protein